MTEDRFWELVNREIDQELSPSEKRELEACLDRHPGWAARRAELMNISRLLEQSEDLEAPADMAANILGALPKGRTQARIAQRVKPGPTSLWSRFSLRYVYAFAGGAVVGAALLALVVRTGPDSIPVSHGDLSGTIMFRELPEGFAVIDRRSIDAGEVTGSIEIGRSADLVVARVELISDYSVELMLRFESDQLAIAGFSRMNSEATAVALGEQEIRLAHTGANEYHVVWTRVGSDSTTIRLTMSAEDIVIYEQSLTIPWSGE